MGLKAAVQASSGRAGGQCSFVRLYEELPRGDARDLREMLGDRSWTSAQITRGLRLDGHATTYNAVTRHRNGTCRCGAL